MNKKKRIRGYTILLLFILFCTSKNLNAQFNVVKVDFFGLIYPELTVFRPSYERTLNDKISLLFTFEIGKYSVGKTSSGYGGTGVEVYTIKGFGIMPEIRYYVTNKAKKAPKGFFIGSHLRYRSLIENYTDSINIDTHGNEFSIGINSGYKFVMRPFVIDLLIGYGVGTVVWESPNNRDMIDEFFTENNYMSTNQIRLEISIGFIFPKYYPNEKTK